MSEQGYQVPQLSWNLHCIEQNISDIFTKLNKIWHRSWKDISPKSKANFGEIPIVWNDKSWTLTATKQAEACRQFQNTNHQ